MVDFCMVSNTRDLLFFPTRSYAMFRFNCSSFNLLKPSQAPVISSQVKAFLLYFLSGLRKGLRELGYRSLPELHEGLEKELLRMECRLPYGLQLRESRCQKAVANGQLPQACRA